MDGGTDAEKIRQFAKKCELAPISIGRYLDGSVPSPRKGNLQRMAKELGLDDQDGSSLLINDDDNNQLPEIETQDWRTMADGEDLCGVDISFAPPPSGKKWTMKAEYEAVNGIRIRLRMEDASLDEIPVVSRRYRSVHLTVLLQRRMAELLVYLANTQACVELGVVSARIVYYPTDTNSLIAHRYKLQCLLWANPDEHHVAYDLLDQRPVLITIRRSIHRRLEGHPFTLEKLKAIAADLSALQLPNISPFINFAEVESADFDFLVQQFVTPLTLNSVLRSRSPHKTFSPETACRLISDVAKSLAHVHRLGIVHTNIKPSSLLVRTGVDCSLVLCNFDYAHRLPVSVGPEFIAGTPDYMPPEQRVGGMKDVGPGADIYSLSLILCELLSSRRYPRIETEKPSGLLDSAFARESGLDLDLLAIIAKGLEQSIENRFRTAQDLAGALDGYLLTRSLL